MIELNNNRQSFRHDVLIIGGGAAGLSLALHLEPELKVAVISKGREDTGSTYYAQGGISAVLHPDDSFKSHIADTLNAGNGLCDEAAVRFTVEHAPENIQWLADLGVPFTTDTHKDGSKSYHLTREGGHSHRRVIHAADATGRALETTLINHARHNKNIELFDHHIAVDLITGSKLGLKHNRCIGAYVLNEAKGRVETFQAKCVILATGGANKVYLYTSNPDGSTGDGIAMAWRAGCNVANMEFMQFHPTCLYHPKAKTFLLTEALRGEGGKLLLPNGKRFMDQFDSRGELAPRDIVARAIDHEMKRLGVECMYLDISHKSAAFITSHFPMIYKKCREFGFDITKEAVPVVPAAHYTCGGVMTDLNGQTSIENLYAIGETSFTGLHGANRMASNSLLECLVFAQSAATDINSKMTGKYQWDKIKDWDESRVTDSDEEVVVSHNWDELRRFMWDYVGIVRTDKRLQRAKRRVDLLRSEINEYYGNFRITGDLLELRNLAVVADLIIRCAMERKESRGLHYTLDYPEMDNSKPATNTILKP
ncbi:MAG: L-aspartate oxidase [Gammaproteobacteria bacterium]|nr:L-aspartate oxidase [Gammaproteobacteria bacterium]MCW8911440.1 L-aspartate oxidase [Gammaproteobacteria bacterium]MCW9004545.1 L-aspartate oxidase [Gammaproteobacteria bacterium]MCW9055970.1 L-aspartate oxidase [Gammaproteobacteria bacterium]